MTYDPVDTNDDGVVDADVDNQSVSTEEGNIRTPRLGQGDGHLNEAASPFRTIAEADSTTKKNDSPVAFALSDDHIIIVYREGPTGDQSNDETLVQIESTDGGNTWSAPETILDTSYQPLTHGGGLTSNGTLLLIVNESSSVSGDFENLLVLRSTDEGKSWSTNNISGLAKSSDNNEVFGSLTEISGTIMLPVCAFGATDETYLIVSNDDGRSWTTGATIQTGTKLIEADMAADGGGNIILLARERGNNSADLYQYQSTDSGSSWSSDGESGVGGDWGMPVGPRIYHDPDYDAFRCILGMRCSGAAGDRSTIRNGHPAGELGNFLWATVDDTNVFNDATNWNTHIWGINASEDKSGTKGYAYVAEKPNGERIIPMSWRDQANGDTRSWISMSMTTDAVVRQLITSGRRLVWQYSRKADWIVGDRGTVVYSSSQITIDTTSPATTLTKIDLSGTVPENASQVLIGYGGDGDGSSSSKAFIQIAADDGPFDTFLGNRGWPADDGISRFDRFWLPVEAGPAIYYKTTNMSTAKIEVIAYR